MNRRRFLNATGTLLTVALAGCAHPSGMLSMDAVDDAELVRRTSVSLSDLPSESSQRDLVEAAIAGESPRVTETHPPVELDEPIHADGRFYDLTSRVVDETTEQAYSFEVDYDPEDTSGPAIDYADLPDRDAEALSGFFPPDEEAPRNEGPDVGVGGVRYTEEQTAASVLVPDTEYELIVFEGARYRVHVEGPREVTVETYEYGATEIAENQSVYVAQLRERSLFRLSGLSQAERDVVETAIEETYYADSPDDEAFNAVVERLRAHEGIGVSEHEGKWLVVYEGETYLAEVMS